MASMKHDPEGAIGPPRPEPGDQLAAHRVAGQDEALDAELVDGPTEQLRVVVDVRDRDSGRPWVAPCPAVSMATTRKPIDTRRDSDWAYRNPSAEKPCTTTSGTPSPATVTPTVWPSESVTAWRAR